MCLNFMCRVPGVPGGLHLDRRLGCCLINAWGANSIRGRKARSSKDSNLFIYNKSFGFVLGLQI